MNLNIDTSPFYDKNSKGDEIYKKSSLNHEMYRYDTNGNPIYAKLQNGEYYYAKDSSGVEQYGFNYLTDLTWISDIVFLNKQGQPVYRKNDSNEEVYGCKYNPKMDFYAQDSNSKEIYAKPPYFAKNELQKEFYAKDDYLNEYYPKNDKGDEFFFGYKYAKTANDKEIYPKTASGDEYLIYEDNFFKYAKDENHKDFYPKKSTGDEFYFYDEGNLVMFAEDMQGNRFYCKDKNLNEFYPENGFIIYQNKFIYCKDKNGFVIYPKNEQGHEFYISESNSFENLVGEKIKSYANVGNRFAYPTKTTNYGIMEVPIDQYIKQIGTNETMYPLDEFNNEYAPLGIDPTIGNPITKNGFEISSYKNNPFIVELLFRSFQRQYDFVTNILSKRVPRTDKKITISSITKPYVPSNLNKPLIIKVIPPTNPNYPPTVVVSRQATKTISQKSNSKFSIKYLLFIISILCAIGALLFSFLYL